MKIKATLLLAAFLWTFISIAGDNVPRTWKAILNLEGKGKSYVFTSEAVYGGFQEESHKVFLFGKNHMFLNQAEPEAMKVFHDLCVTNAMQQFQFEVSGIPAESNPASRKSVSGNISMKKRKPIQAEYRTAKGKEGNSVTIETSGQLGLLGFTLTAEATKLFTGKYTLTFVSSN